MPTKRKSHTPRKGTGEHFIKYRQIEKFPQARECCERMATEELFFKSKE